MVDPLITKKYNYPFADRVSSPLYEITKQYYNGDPIKGEAKRGIAFIPSIIPIPIEISYTQ